MSGPLRVRDFTAGGGFSDPDGLYGHGGAPEARDGQEDPAHRPDHPDRQDQAAALVAVAQEDLVEVAVVLAALVAVAAELAVVASAAGKQLLTAKV